MYVLICFKHRNVVLVCICLCMHVVTCFMYTHRNRCGPGRCYATRIQVLLSIQQPIVRFTNLQNLNVVSATRSLSLLSCRSDRMIQWYVGCWHVCPQHELRHVVLYHIVAAVVAYHIVSCLNNDMMSWRVVSCHVMSC